MPPDRPLRHLSGSMNTIPTCRHRARGALSPSCRGAGRMDNARRKGRLGVGRPSLPEYCYRHWCECRVLTRRKKDRRKSLRTTTVIHDNRNITDSTPYVNHEKERILRILPIAAIGDSCGLGWAWRSMTAKKNTGRLGRGRPSPPGFAADTVYYPCRIQPTVGGEPSAISYNAPLYPQRTAFSSGTGA